MKTKLWVLASISTILVLSPALCHAASSSVCTADVQKFCWDVDENKSHIKQCLYDHYMEISDDCYNALKKFSHAPQEQPATPSPNDAINAPDADR